MKEVTVSRHAIERYRERTGAKYSEDKIINKIKQLCKTGIKELINKKYYLVYVGTNCFIVKNNNVVTFQKGSPIIWRHL